MIRSRCTSRLRAAALALPVALIGLAAAPAGAASPAASPAPLPTNVAPFMLHQGQVPGLPLTTRPVPFSRTAPVSRGGCGLAGQPVASKGYLESFFQAPQASQLRKGVIGGDQLTEELFISTEPVYAKAYASRVQDALRHCPTFFYGTTTYGSTRGSVAVQHASPTSVTADVTFTTTTNAGSKVAGTETIAIFQAGRSIVILISSHSVIQTTGRATTLTLSVTPATRKELAAAYDRALGDAQHA